MIRQKFILINSLEDKDKLSLLGEGMGEKFIHKFINQRSDNPPISFKEFNKFMKELNEGEEGLFFIDLGKFVDEESKININKVDKTVLRQLFKNLGFSEQSAEAISASIVDWRDKDSELSSPLEGAEDTYYRSLEYPYEAKDGDFEVLEELLLLKDVDEEVFEKIKDFLTIYGEGRVNINTASRIVLSSLGMSNRLIEKILLYRAGEDGVEGTEDDNFFLTNSEIVPKLSQNYHLSDSEISELNGIIDKYLTTTSHNFMLEYKIGLKNKKRTSAIVAVFNIQGKILYWREI